jgi:hypothetical protein
LHKAIAAVPAWLALFSAGHVLGQIFGLKDVSRAVAQNAASQTGLDPGLLRQMLPMLAMLVAGYMAKQRGGADQVSPAGLAAMLDVNGDGNVLDDVMRKAGKAMR